MRMPFTLTCSNYMAHVHAVGIDRKFVQSLQSKRCFAAFAKLKSDVKTKPVPDVSRDGLIYFHHDFRQAALYPQVMNVDLKSAYATCLLNGGYISNETYAYLSKISKNDRLASVGMLASKKKIFDFDTGGVPFKYEEKHSEYENFFYYAVKSTYDIMSELKKICGSKYLFTWVDGIYFTPCNDTLQECIDFLSDYNFRYSVDMLNNFEVKILDSYAKVEFKKEGKLKRFAIPIQISEFKRLAVDTLLLLNNKQNKNGKSVIQRKTAR